MDGVGSADGVDACFGEAEVEDLALVDQLCDRACGLLDRRVPVDTVLVVQVDVVGTEAGQRSLDGGADVGRAAVDRAGDHPIAVRDEAELGGDDDVVAAALQCPADDLLTVEWAVDLGSVEMGDAEVEGAVDRADGLRVVDGAFAGVRARHGHGAEADAGDVEASE